VSAAVSTGVSAGAARGRVAVDGLRWRPWGRATPVLDDVRLVLDPGERVLLAGPSGAGKSTLLLALAGLLHADDGELSGRVDVGGRTGLLLQDPQAAVVARRAGRDAAFGPENRGVQRPVIWQQVTTALRDSGFPYDVHHDTHALSGGEGQRLALAGALALAPDVLLLDEPTAMLDAPTADRVRTALLAASGGRTLVVVEHRSGPWLEHVDRVVVLSSSGAVVADGPPATVLAQQRGTLAAQGFWLPDAEHAVRPLVLPPDLATPQRTGPRTLLEASGLRARPLGWRAPRLSAPEPRLSAPDGVPGGAAGSTAPAGVGPVDVRVGAGTAVTLTGPSGAGKSTVLAALAGLTAPTAGTLLADPGWSPRRAGARGPERRPHRWRSRELAARVAWLPQLPEHALVARTVGQEVRATSRALRLPATETDRRARALLEVLGLAGLGDRDPHTLSGGEQRRLGLAAALAHGPALLLLDEPTVGQDRATWAAVVAVLQSVLAAGTGVVVASHDDELLRALDRPTTSTVELGGEPVRRAAP
jgi:energy-coupling factor transporter ATP-binding protein EcfA2